MKNIPQFNLQRQYLALQKELQAAVEETLKTQTFILGDEVTQFEQEVALLIGATHAIGCASGTDAIHLSLRALDIGDGDEVITTAFSFIAGAEAIAYTGAIPIFADIEADSFNINPTVIENLITPKTRALLVVHLYGQPCNMDAINTICKQHNLYCIEDCAQAFGARYKDKRIGSLGTIACHSFYPTKNLGAYGDGGMVTTSDDALAKQVKLLRNHYNDGNYLHSKIGYNSRLDEMQAAILRVKLRYLDAANEKRRQLADFYQQHLSDCVITPKIMLHCEHVFHQYTIRSKQRDQLQFELTQRGIGNRIYYPVALSEQPVFKQLGNDNHCSVSNTVADECLSIPMFPELRPDEAETVINTIIDVCSQ